MRNRLTEDKPTMFIDQHGRPIVASTAKELCEKAGYAKATKQYQDKRGGPTVWNGYVVGPHWFTALKWREVPA